MAQHGRSFFVGCMMRILITGGSGFIGTHLIENLFSWGKNVLNIDVKSPVISSHHDCWKECDILDRTALFSEFHNYRPTHVVHLAARTDMAGKDLDSYRSNTEGTFNVLEAVKSTASIERIIITSSQFVYQFSGKPKHAETYAPHTVYGESKVLTEKYTREADFSCVWTIIRPTNIWGPWHPRYPVEFWRVLKKGGYLHPGRKPVMRMYGYVGNVVDQILNIFKLAPEKVNGKVLYVGDPAINLLDWVNGFSLALLGRDVTIVPRVAVRSLALVGDLFSTLDVSFPITSSRYRSMTVDNEVSMEETFALLGPPLYSLQEGIDETVKWLIGQDPQFWTPSRS